MLQIVAILIAKIIFKLNRLTGTGGAALPGLVAKKIDDQILLHLCQNNFPDGIIVVTGTNGKTTTTKLIADILEVSDISYLHNKTGSNLERGIVSEMLRRANWRGRIDTQVALLEVDEASIPAVLSQLNARTILVTNLFRDQLDRYGELQTTAQMIKKGLASQQGATILLNADDPLVASLADNDSNTYKFFGISDFNGPVLKHDYTADSVHSPISNAPLVYSKKYFSHMGVYKSKNGDFVRPKPDWELIKMKNFDTEGSRFMLQSETAQSQEIDLSLPGIYNIYNAIAAIAVAETQGIDEKSTTKVLKNSTAAFGRYEKIRYRDRDVVIVLIKNPTGFNQAIQTYLQDKKQTLVLAINDNFADGRDVSWLWDAAIEDIRSGRIIVGGLRRYDMALRLKYADKTGQVVDELTACLDRAIDVTKEGEPVYILPTYTAMLEIRRFLVKETEMEDYWK